MTYARAWTDKEMLELLESRDRGRSFSECAKRVGRRRNACIGMAKRIKDDTDRCFPPCDAEGTMPRMWWTDGLRARR